MLDNTRFAYEEKEKSQAEYGLFVQKYMVVGGESHYNPIQ